MVSALTRRGGIAGTRSLAVELERRGRHRDFAAEAGGGEAAKHTGRYRLWFRDHLGDRAPAVRRRARFHQPVLPLAGAELGEDRSQVPTRLGRVRPALGRIGVVRVGHQAARPSAVQTCLELTLDVGGKGKQPD